MFNWKKVCEKLNSFKNAINFVFEIKSNISHISGSNIMISNQIQIQMTFSHFPSIEKEKYFKGKKKIETFSPHLEIYERERIWNSKGIIKKRREGECKVWKKILLDFLN